MPLKVLSLKAMPLNKVYFVKNMPSPARLRQALDLKPQSSILLTADQKLKTKIPLRGFESVYFVKAGEGLKNVKFFNSHVQNILKLIKNRPLRGFVSLGGGSVGDFTGFLSHVWQRGQPVVHIPTTWLAALDSAHGGKTALNAGGVKNLLGGFAFPKAVFIVQSILEQLPQAHIRQARGELLKTAFISGGGLYAQLLANPSLTPALLQSVLPGAIALKLKITAEDPLDQKNLRKKLNLGHTAGHILESYFKIGHGEAVECGLSFALEMSRRHLKLSLRFLKEAQQLLNRKKLLYFLKKIPMRSFESLLLKDKKISRSNQIQFVFIKKPGEVLVQNTAVKTVCQCALALKKAPAGALR